MKRRLTLVTFLVRDYDKAIAWFTEILGFALMEDVPLGGGRRWIRVAPANGADGAELLLSRATTSDEMAAVGRQGGGRVFLFLMTDNFARDHAAMRERGITFIEEPRKEDYGEVAVFTDLYGNKWDLIGPPPPRE